MKILFRVLIFILMIFLLGISFFWQNDLNLGYLTQKYTDESSSFMEIGGMNIHYKIEGNTNDSLPLILLHGTGASLHTWDDWVDLLKSDKLLVRLDLPAFGLTGPNPKNDYSMELYVKVITQFLDKLNIQKCIISGNSLGGGIAILTTKAIPEKVKALILIDAMGYATQSKSTPLAMRLAKVPVLRALIKNLTTKSMIQKSVENVYYDIDKIKSGVVDRYYELALRPGNRKAFIERMNHERFPDFSGVIKSTTTPTLIIWGEFDRLIPLENAYQFNSDIKNSKLLIIENSGHVPMEENPQESVIALKSFLKDLH